MADEVKELENEELEEPEEEHESRYVYTNGFNSFDHVMREIEESSKIGPSVDSIIFFWGPLFIILIAICALGA